MREGTELFAEAEGAAVGTITSGGFGPSLDAPVAMGYVPIELGGARHAGCSAGCAGRCCL